jgi:hypothetical protein
MSPARYRFLAGRRYFAWPVAAKPMDLPGLDRLTTAVKVTLATPYLLEGKKLVSSRRLEAVLWLFPPGDSKALTDLGIDGRYRLTQRRVCLWCEFTQARGLHGYQALARYEIVPPGQYPVEPVVVIPRTATGLSIDGDTAKYRGKEVNLSLVLLQILRALDATFPSRVSVDELRGAVTRWDQHTEGSTIAQAVNALKQKLPLGLSISPRDGDQGWSLIKTDKSRMVP